PTFRQVKSNYLR
ncbi:ABC transporter family protein, partial [Vibrio parahaemolyticus V-223/04]